MAVAVTTPAPANIFRLAAIKRARTFAEDISRPSLIIFPIHFAALNNNCRFIGRSAVKRDTSTNQARLSFPPKHAPTVWTYISYDVFAGIRCNKQAAAAALTITFWLVLIIHRRFRQWICVRGVCVGGENSCDARCTRCALQ